MMMMMMMTMMMNRYVGTTSNETIRSKREECSSSSHSASFDTIEEEVTAGEDYKNKFKKEAQKCKGDESNHTFFSENSFDEYSVLTRGSIPTVRDKEKEDWKGWMSHVEKSPVPLNFKLIPISELFLPEWLSEHGLDAPLLREYFTNSLKNYCEVVLGRPCETVKGCGLTGFCSEKEVRN